MNKYWIPGPITNYATTDAGFHGEVRVVLASDHETWLTDRIEERDDSNRNLTAALQREAALEARLSESQFAYLSAWTRLTKEERLHGYTMEERDHAEEMADKLADAIATLLGVEIGEHSNMNCPWTQALEAFEERAASTVTQDAAP